MASKDLETLFDKLKAKATDKESLRELLEEHKAEIKAAYKSEPENGVCEIQTEYNNSNEFFYCNDNYYMSKADRNEALKNGEMVYAGTIVITDLNEEYKIEISANEIMKMEYSLSIGKYLTIGNDYDTPIKIDAILTDENSLSDRGEYKPVSYWIYIATDGKEEYDKGYEKHTENDYLYMVLESQMQDLPVERMKELINLDERDGIEETDILTIKGNILSREDCPICIIKECAADTDVDIRNIIRSITDDLMESMESADILTDEADGLDGVIEQFRAEIEEEVEIESMDYDTLEEDV